MDKVNVLNKIAILTLVLAKVAGFLGIALAYTGQTTIGGWLLFADGVLIVTSLALCFKASAEMNTKDETDKAIVARLIREGTLKQYVRDIETKKTNVAA